LLSSRLSADWCCEDVIIAFTPLAQAPIRALGALPKTDWIGWSQTHNVWARSAENRQSNPPTVAREVSRNSLAGDQGDKRRTQGNRFVTGVNEHGRSYAVSSEELTSSDFQTLWDYNPSDVPDWISAIDPEPAAEWIGPEIAGGLCCRTSTKTAFIRREPSTSTT